ncbi:MAG TPA: hypothetical protein VFV52_08020 [Bacilli bacterium]|nr:hypothetical protein [Bacilli bacterium]
MNDAGELVWPNPNATGQLAGTEYLQPGSPLGWSTAVSSQPEYSQYGDLQDALTANGYTVVPFTYDWRQSLKEVMGEFDRFVEDVRWEQDVATVDIVADSTGGLIAKRYILDHKSVHPIRRLISIGTPYFGSPTAVAQLEGGMDKFGMHLDPTLLQSWPGFYDFLPLRT